MQRLGKNKHRYFGETINIESVLEKIKLVAVKNGWRRDLPLVANGLEFLAYRREMENARSRLYLSSGIHGDEPAGPLAVLQLLEENAWPDDLDVSLCPCLNPSGFTLNTRENASGIDLNRDYRHLTSAEIKNHVAWLNGQSPFDLSLCLHEDWEANGFYIYELNPDLRPSFAVKIISAVSAVCPLETAKTADGWDVINSVISPAIAPEERPQWPEALFLMTAKTRQSYTLESPSDFPMETRVAAHVAAVRAVLESM